MFVGYCREGRRGGVLGEGLFAEVGGVWGVGLGLGRVVDGRGFLGGEVVVDGGIATGG